MFQRIFEKFKDISVNRMLVVLILLIAMYTVAFIRVFNIQVIDSNKTNSEELVTNQLERGYKTYTTYTNPVRGLIYDRDGVLLAYNESSYNLDFYNTASLATNKERNEAIYQLIKILEKYNLKREFDFPLIINDNGELEYTVSDNALYRFLKNCYGLRSANDLNDEQKETSPEDLFNYLAHGTKYLSMFGIDEEIYSRKYCLEIMAYRYMLYTNYPSYASIRLITDISDDFRMVILENMSLIPCVEISKSYKRVYNDAECFSHIIGYIGLITDEELREFEAAKIDNYTSKSIIGKTGVEKSYDNYLQGSLGETKVTVNKAGQIVRRDVVVEPVDGGDLYLSVDRDMQVAGYNLMKKNIASVLINHIVDKFDPGKFESADDIVITIYEVYNALINNNVIDIKRFDDETASENEKRVYDLFSQYKSTVIRDFTGLLSKDYTGAYKNLKKPYQDYCDYVYNGLRYDWGVINKNIDSDSEHFVNYNSGTIGINKFIEDAIENGNVNTNALNLDEGYYETSEIYDLIVEFILDKIENDLGFDKVLYKTLILNGTVKGRDLSLILFDQGIIKPDRDSYEKLTKYTLDSYTFIIRKINNLEITPAQLALKPYSGSMVATDPNNGKVLAMVSYPGYDNNKMTNSIDLDYYRKLTNDMSYPLLCSATQTKTNTGSTFKPLSAVMGVTEHVINVGTRIEDEVVFEKIVPSPSCWYKSGHGNSSLANAITGSCNYYFFETAYRMSLNDKEEYSDDKGMNIIHKYGRMFGFYSLSGVEISEVEPVISNSDAIRTAIGYGHSFAPVHIAKYATTISNSGTCYDLTLIDKVTDKSGNIMYEQKPSVYYSLDQVTKECWDTVYEGMYNLIEGQLYEEFGRSGIKVAGKTGTAQVSLNDPNNALFISFGPFEKPEICVTTVMPYAYKSYNAVATTADFYAFLFADENRENILSGNIYAGKGEDGEIGDN